jgi:hypothetical protein
MPGLDFGEEEEEDAAAMKKKRLALNLGKFQRRRKSHSFSHPSSSQRRSFQLLRRQNTEKTVLARQAQAQTGPNFPLSLTTLCCGTGK